MNGWIYNINVVPKLICWFGNWKGLKLSKKPSKNQIALGVLKHHVGEEMFNELMDSLEGATIYFSPDITSRNKKIKEEYENGNMTVEELMNKYGLSKSRIYDLIDVIPK